RELRAGLCDRCAVTEEHMRKKQQEFENIRQQNLKLITELMNEKNNLQDENKKISEHLQQLQKEQQAMELEEGIIPDSPVQSFSLSVVNRIRRKKENRHVRYTEQTHTDLEHSDSTNGKSSLCKNRIKLSCMYNVLIMPFSIHIDKQGSYPVAKPSFNLAAVVAETIGLVQEESVSNVPECLSSLNMFRLSDPSQNTPTDVDWDSQVASPVFGASNYMKNSLTSSLSPSVLETGLKSNAKKDAFNSTFNSRSHKVRSKSEDVAFVAPLNLGTEVNSVISQASASRQMVVKRDANESITCMVNTCLGKDEMIKNDFLLAPHKHLVDRSIKRKKTEDERVTSCEKTSFNKENSFPFQADIQPFNADHIIDKPLDLSDRFSAIRCQEKSSRSDDICKNRLRQVTLHDVFSQLVKPVPKGSSSIQNINNGSYLSGKESQEDLYEQEMILQSRGKTCPDKKPLMQIKEEISAFKIPSLPNTVETEQLFDDMKVASDHEPIRKKTRTGHGECELASVLQPNPCRATKPKPLQNEQDKPSLENIQWSIDPGADLSQYKMDITVIDTKEGSQSRVGGETDMDYTYVSESMLLKVKTQEQKGESSPSMYFSPLHK
uniref:DNA endonuclease RBBP8 n=1 Tax=Chelonoidis abingdonii TaxID=106734 RepID=A0A8C0GEL1_CHEAB